MTTLSRDKPRPFEQGDIQEYPMVADDVIYVGAALGVDSAGRARPLVAGDQFLGFADRTVDNTRGAAGALLVRVRRRGQVRLSVSGASAATANAGALVFATDDDTFSLTAVSDSIVGRVARWVSSGVCVVDFDARDAAAEESNARWSDATGTALVAPNGDIVTAGDVRLDALPLTVISNGAFVVNGSAGPTTPGAGSYQTALGVNAGAALTTGIQTAIGNSAGYYNTTGNQTAVGNSAGQGNITGFQTAIGYAAGYTNSTGTQTAIGYSAGYSNTTGTQIAVGHTAGFSNTTGEQTAIGHLAGFTNTTGYQTAIGHQAGYFNLTGTQTVIGYGAGYNNTSGTQTAVGHYAGFTNTTGTQTAIGSNAGFLNTTGVQTAVGQSAGYTNSTGTQTAIGHEAGYYNTTGIQTAVGFQAAKFSTGDGVTVVGSSAGVDLTTGNNVTILGQHPGAAGLANALILATGTTARIRYDTTDGYQFDSMVPAVSAATASTHKIPIKIGGVTYNLLATNV